MIHLRGLELRARGDDSAFPFNVPSIRSLETLSFENPVTLFVGENGTGKSTLIEALAAAAGTITAGAAPIDRAADLKEIRKLSRQLKLTWNVRTEKGFFLRAEDFIGWIRAQKRTRTELHEELERVDREYEDRSEYAKGLARMPAAGQLKAMQDRYGDGLEYRSHGQQFLEFFQTRFVPGGLYLLDEPEAPLSPMRQLAFLSLLKEMVAQEAQFIIATHSPILLACTEAEILSFDHQPVQPVAYDSLEHVRIMRDFLNNPEAYLRHL